MLVYAVRKLGKKFEAKTITIDTSEFFLNKKKIGIGSSSAVSVAILKALVKL